MNKGEFVKELAKKFKLPISKTEDIVSSTLETITKSLAKGENVVFVGFGTFSIKRRNARTGRNPRSGATIKIPARKIVRFTAGKALKNAVNKK